MLPALSSHQTGPKYGYRAKRGREWTLAAGSSGMKKWNLSLSIPAGKVKNLLLLLVARYLDRQRAQDQETKNGCKQRCKQSSKQKTSLMANKEKWQTESPTSRGGWEEHQVQQFKRKKKMVVLMESWKGVRPSRSLTQFEWGSSSAQLPEHCVAIMARWSRNRKRD